MSTAVIQENKNLIIKWLLTIALTLACFLIPTTETFTFTMKIFAVNTIFGILLMAFEVVPLLVPAVTLPLGYMIFNVAPASTVWNGWTGDIPWTIMGAMLVASIMQRTGASNRVVFFFLKLAKGNFKVLMFAFFVPATLLASIIPSSIPRVAIFCTIMLSLCTAMGFKPQSKAAAMCFCLVAVLGDDTSTQFLTGASTNVTMLGLMQQRGYDPSYMQYLQYNFVPSSLFVLCSIALALWIFKSDETKISTKDWAEEQYKSLGKMDKNQLKALIYAAVLILMLIGKNIHGLGPGKVFMIMILLAFLPGFNVGKKEDIKAINFEMVLVIVATLAVGEAAVYCGAGPVLVSAILPHMPEGNIAICAFFYVVAYAGNLLLTPLGIVAGFGGTLMDLAGAMGLSPVGISYIFLFSLHQCILPYELQSISWHMDLA